MGVRHAHDRQISSISLIFRRRISSGNTIPHGNTIPSGASIVVWSVGLADWTDSAVMVAYGYGGQSMVHDAPGGDPPRCRRGHRGDRRRHVSVSTGLRPLGGRGHPPESRRRVLELLAAWRRSCHAP